MNNHLVVTKYNNNLTLWLNTSIPEVKLLFLYSSIYISPFRFHSFLFYVDGVQIAIGDRGRNVSVCIYIDNKI